MNKILKKAIQLTILSSVTVGLFSGVAYGNNCNSAMIANSVYNVDTGIATIPLVEMIDDPMGTLDFVMAQFQRIPGQLSFMLTSWTQLNDDCAFVNIPTSVFNFDTSEFYLPRVQVKTNNAVSFYNVHLNWTEETQFELQKLEKTKGRYSGRVIDANGQPIAGATVSLNGIEAEQSTNGDGYFTEVDISNEICQILTVNATGFAPISMEVDIRLPDLTPCANS